MRGLLRTIDDALAGRMRSLPVVALALLIVVLVAVPSPSAAPHMGGSRLDPVIGVVGCAPGVVGTCTVTVFTQGPSLVFFRYDLDADGDWEFPDETGGGAMGKWTTLTTVTTTFVEPSRGVCVLAWDGVSVRTIGGQLVPWGPRGCSGFSEFRPNQWDRNSPDRALWVTFTAPSWLSPGDFSPRGAEVEGIRAFPSPFIDRFGDPDPGVWRFRVDRVALTRLLGPGTHTVHLAVPWAGLSFTSADLVTIL